MATELARIPKGNDQFFSVLITYTNAVNGSETIQGADTAVNLNEVQNLSVKAKHATCGDLCDVPYQIEGDQQGLMSVELPQESQQVGEYTLVVEFDLPNEKASDGLLHRLVEIPLCIVVHPEQMSNYDQPKKVRGQVAMLMRGKKGEPFNYEDFTDEQLNSLILSVVNEIISEHKADIKGENLLYSNLSSEDKRDLTKKVKDLLLEQSTEILRGRDLTFESLTSEQQKSIVDKVKTKLIAENSEELKGDAFTYEDFTREQLIALARMVWELIPEEEKAKFKGDAFRYSDFTTQQISEIITKLRDKIIAENRDDIAGQDLLFENLSPEQQQSIVDKVKAKLVAENSEDLKGEKGADGDVVMFNKGYYSEKILTGMSNFYTINKKMTHSEFLESIKAQDFSLFTSRQTNNINYENDACIWAWGGRKTALFHYDVVEIKENYNAFIRFGYDSNYYISRASDFITGCIVVKNGKVFKDISILNTQYIYIGLPKGVYSIYFYWSTSYGGIYWADPKLFTQLKNVSNKKYGTWENRPKKTDEFPPRSGDTYYCEDIDRGVRGLLCSWNGFKWVDAFGKPVTDRYLREYKKKHPIEEGNE